MAFVKSSIPVGVSLWDLCSFSAHAYLYLSSFISADYYTRRSVCFRTIWLYRLWLDVLLTILVLCDFLCGIYKFNVQDLVAAYHLKCLIWDAFSCTLW